MAGCIADFNMAAVLANNQPRTFIMADLNQYAAITLSLLII